MRAVKQNREGLPDQILEEKRFFPLPSQKKDILPDDWNNPEKWVFIDDIPEKSTFGFAIGNSSNYLFIDADHVIDPETGNIISWVLEAYNRITQYGNTYTEISMSGTGFHMICDLKDFADDFSRESNGYSQIIVAMDPEEYGQLSKEEKAKTPKIEFFYHTEGRYVYLTGNHARLYQVAQNEEAAAIFTELLKIRKEFHEKYGKRALSEDHRDFKIDEITKKRVLEALPYISANSRDTWITIGIALSNCGFPFEVWDTWSRFTDQRQGIPCDKYSPDETPKIWRSFKNSKSNWNAGTIIKYAKEKGYRIRGAPEQEGSVEQKKRGIRPFEFSDVEQAEIFVSEYGEKVRYSSATGFLVYSGKRWEEDTLKAQRLSQKLTDRQLFHARSLLKAAREKADAVAEGSGGSLESASVKYAVRQAEEYRKNIIKRRSSARITATLTEAAPSVAIKVTDLDSDGFILNTPGGTVNLRTGELRKNDPENYCTKITAVAPGPEGKETFEKFLDQITCNDPDLKRYLQEICGSFAVGEVKREELFIVTGHGGNGKSTFFNLLYKVFGDYAGLLSSDILITNNRKNKSPELAELRGKRMILAAELDEGTRLDAAIVKKLASTDPIRAERKYKDPFDFIPSHSVILYTNHLPKVGARDSGTWDRLRVIPFDARFRNTHGEIKDYTSVLYEKCGGAVLSWIIEGARRYIRNDFFIKQPERVKRAIEEYRRSNDWLSAFLSERCYVRNDHLEAAGELYRDYRQFCNTMGDFPRHAAEFKQALESIGIEHKKTKSGMIYKGVRLKTTMELEADKFDAKREASLG